jgi:hypothetical protein
MKQLRANAQQLKFINAAPTFSAFVASAGLDFRFNYHASTGYLGMYLVYLGVILCLTSSFASVSVAKNVHSSKAVYFINVLWLVISAVIVIGFILECISFGTSPLDLLNSQ